MSANLPASVDVRRTSRAIGSLLLVLLFVSPVMNFGLLGPVFAKPGFLVNAAPHALDIGLAVVLKLVTGAVSVSIAILVWPVFRRHGTAFGLWYFAFATASFALAAAECVAMLSMLSLSQAYAAAGSPTDGVYPVLSEMVGAVRNWTHYLQLVVAGAAALGLYGGLLRYALVPRILAGFGVAAVALQMTTVALPLFGRPVMFVLLAPIGIAHLALAFWLLTKGLAAGDAAGVSSQPGHPSPMR